MQFKGKEGIKYKDVLYETLQEGRRAVGKQ